MFGARRSNHLETERSRMAAILGDAIARYRRGAEADSARVANWMRADDWHSSLSFNRVCAALDIDPGSTRARVLGGAEETQLAAA